MRVGVLRETKDRELRVALLPAGARTLAASGHQVSVETAAGEGSGFSDADYEAVGARILASAEDVIASCDIVTKVKEPTLAEISAMRPGQALFDFLHLAPEPELARRILDRGIIAIGFETVRLDDGSLPLLVPMSEVAGRLAVQIGAHYLQADQGGRGVLLGGVPGVPRGRVAVIGAGIVGTAAVRMAVGLGAEVAVLDVDQRKLSHLYDIYHGGIDTLYSNVVNLEQSVLEADIVVGAVLLPGARAPVLVDRGDEAGLGDRGRGRGPGRLRRDDSPDVALQAGLRGARRDPLRGAEHAGRGAAHVDAGAEQRDVSVPSGAVPARRGRGTKRQPRTRARRELLARTGHAEGPGRCAPRPVRRVALGEGALSGPLSR
jgi:hypothetical protein